MGPLRLLADSEVQTNLLGRGWSRKPRPSVSCPGPSGSGLPAAPPEGRGHGDLRLGERAHQARPALGAAGGIRARPPHPQLHPLSAGPCDLGLRCWHGGGRAAGPGEGQAWPRAQGQPGWQDLHPLTPRPAPQATAGAGIVSGFDMTSEAALAKLSYVLGQPGLSLDARKEVRAPAAGGVGEGVPEGGGGGLGRQWGPVRRVSGSERTGAQGSPGCRARVPGPALGPLPPRGAQVWHSRGPPGWPILPPASQAGLRRSQPWALSGQRPAGPWGPELPGRGDWGWPAGPGPAGAQVCRTEPNQGVPGPGRPSPGQPGRVGALPFQLLARDLRGEMTLPKTQERRPSLRSGSRGLGVAQLLRLSQVPPGAGLAPQVSRAHTVAVVTAGHRQSQLGPGPGPGATWFWVGPQPEGLQGFVQQ